MTIRIDIPFLLNKRIEKKANSKPSERIKWSSFNLFGVRFSWNS